MVGPVEAISKKKSNKTNPSPTHTKDEAYLESVTQKRIQIFDTIKTQQVEERQRIGGESIK